MSTRYIVRLLTGGVLATAPAIAVWSQSPTGSNAAPQSVQTDTSASEAGPELLIAKLPEVTCSRDQLAINAENATFTSIIAAVESCLQISIKLPGGASDERTFLHLGPGKAESVLDDLLSTSGFNYAIVQSRTKPLGIASVTLTSRSADETESQSDRGAAGSTGVPMTAARRLWLANQASNGRPLTTNADDSAHTDNSGIDLKQTSANEVPPKEGTEVQAASSSTVAGSGTGNSTLAATAVPTSGASDTKIPDPSTPATQTQSVTTAATQVPPAVSPTTAAAVTNSNSTESAASGAGGSASEATDAAKVLNRQIQQMQQMFEQRRALNTASTPSTNPGSNSQ